MEGDPNLRPRRTSPTLTMRLRRPDRSARDQGHPGFRDRGCVARSVVRRSSGDYRCDERSERAAAASAHHIRAGEGLRQVRSAPILPEDSRAIEAIREKVHESPGALRCARAPFPANPWRSTGSTGGSRNIDTAASSARCRSDRSSATVTTAEVYIEHYKASFWQQDDVESDHRHTARGGCRYRGMFSKRWAKTALPRLAVYMLNGLVGGVLPRSRRGTQAGAGSLPAQRAEGPPIMAPGLMSIVAALGVLGRRCYAGSASGCRIARSRPFCRSCGPSGRPPEPDWLPRQRRGTTPR